MNERPPILRYPWEAPARDRRAERDRIYDTGKRARPLAALYQTPRWRRERLEHLAAHPVCEGKTPDGRDCLAVDRLEVDHRVPHRGDEKLFWDRGNWQTLCRSCHSRKTRAEAAPRCKGFARAVGVFGPPGSGKSTYVDEHRRRGDVVLDIDALAAALSGCDLRDKPYEVVPLALAARDAVVRKLREPGLVVRVWVVATAPRRSDRAKLLASLNVEQVVILDVPAEECARRIAADPSRRLSRARDLKLVEEWWASYEPSLVGGIGGSNLPKPHSP